MPSMELILCQNSTLDSVIYSANFSGISIQPQIQCHIEWDSNPRSSATFSGIPTQDSVPHSVGFRFQFQCNNEWDSDSSFSATFSGIPIPVSVQHSVGFRLQIQWHKCPPPPPPFFRIQWDSDSRFSGISAPPPHFFRIQWDSDSRFNATFSGIPTLTCTTFSGIPTPDSVSQWDFNFRFSVGFGIE